MAIKYAKEIIPEIAFIRNVFMLHYTKEEFDVLIRLNPDYFDEKEGKKILPNPKYFEPFESNCNVINYEIFERLFSMSNLYRVEKCRSEEEKRKKKAYNDEFRMVLTKSVNLLEAFSLILIEDLAEEKVLYPILHQTFLDHVKLIYPMISMLNTSVEDKFFPNIIRLYKIWEERNDKDRRTISNALKKK